MIPIALLSITFLSIYSLPFSLVSSFSSQPITVTNEVDNDWKMIGIICTVLSEGNLTSHWNYYQCKLFLAYFSLKLFCLLFLSLSAVYTNSSPTITTTTTTPGNSSSSIPAISIFFIVTVLHYRNFDHFSYFLQSSTMYLFLLFHYDTPAPPLLNQWLIPPPPPQLPSLSLQLPRHEPTTTTTIATTRTTITLSFTAPDHHRLHDPDTRYNTMRNAVVVYSWDQ